MKLSVYLDTSVFSAYFDDRVTDRQALTEEFWARAAEFELSTSAVATREISRTPDVALREKLLGLLRGLPIHPITAEAEQLAARYIQEQAFTPAMLDDAMHVAVAVLARQDVLLSWNFKHLVNRRRRAKVNDVNASLGLPAIEIMAPPEVFGD